MDVIKLLKEDHDRVRSLFQKFRGGGGISGLVKRVTGNVSPRERRAAVEQVCRELDLHARLEEEIFYPAVRALGDAELDRLVDESLREHATVKEEVAALRGNEAENDQLDERVGNLEQSVEHHATEEENEMFPRLQAQMPQEQREALGRRIQSAKRAAAPSRARGKATAAGSRARAGTARTVKAGTAKARTVKARTVKASSMRGRTATNAAARRRQSAGKLTARKRAKRPKSVRGGRGR
jgi:hemerythrin superfamily protein